MNARAARPFLPNIRAVERDLALPIPERMRILEELEYDLEALRDRFVADGFSPTEARARALELLLPGRVSLGELGHLHRPLYRRLTQRLRGDRLRLLEQSLLALATFCVLAGQLMAMLRADILSDPSPFLWPVLALGVLLTVACAHRAFVLWVTRDHRDPSRGVRTILMLAGATLTTGVIGTGVDFYRLAGRLEQATAGSAAAVLEWIKQDAALLSVSILLASAGGLAWFVLTHWWTQVSDARRELLGFDPFKPEI